MRFWLQSGCGNSSLARAAKRIARQEDSLGLFDTVAAFGMPATKFSLDGFKKEFESFHNRLAIPDHVETAVHLVSLDEDRSVFLPTLISDEPVNTDSRKEFWFGGNHGDVGGGWQDHDEADKAYRRRQITLRFMLDQEHGLELVDDWDNHDDVRVDSPGWVRCGTKHGGEYYEFKSSYGGQQPRKHLRGRFAVPYDPTPAVLHASAMR